MKAVTHNLVSQRDLDFYLWTQQTVQALRSGDFSQIELDSLIEEVEDMGNSQKDALESNLIRVIQHLLKWKYQPQKRTNSWKASITEHSLLLNKAFKKAPVLSPISSKFLLSAIKMQG